MLARQGINGSLLVFTESFETQNKLARLLMREGVPAMLNPGPLVSTEHCIDWWKSQGRNKILLLNLHRDAHGWHVEADISVVVLNNTRHDSPIVAQALHRGTGSYPVILDERALQL